MENTLANRRKIAESITKTLALNPDILLEFTTSILVQRMENDTYFTRYKAYYQTIWDAVLGITLCQPKE